MGEPLGGLYLGSVGSAASSLIETEDRRSCWKWSLSSVPPCNSCRSNAARHPEHQEGQGARKHGIAGGLGGQGDVQASVLETAL